MLQRARGLLRLGDSLAVAPPASRQCSSSSSSSASSPPPNSKEPQAKSSFFRREVFDASRHSRLATQLETQIATEKARRAANRSTRTQQKQRRNTRQLSGMEQELGKLERIDQEMLRTQELRETLGRRLRIPPEKVEWAQLQEHGLVPPEAQEPDFSQALFTSLPKKVSGAQQLERHRKVTRDARQQAFETRTQNNPAAAGAEFKRLFVASNVHTQLKSKLGFDRPSLLQQTLIPELIRPLHPDRPSDLLVHSLAGSGKTAAALMAIFSNLSTKLRKTQAIIVAPNSELSAQLSQQCSMYKFPGSKSRKKNPLRVHHLRGHISKATWIELKQNPPHVIIATPMCAYQLLQQDRPNVVDVSELRTLLLDDAHMLATPAWWLPINHVLGVVQRQNQANRATGLHGFRCRIVMLANVVSPMLLKLALTHLSKAVCISGSDRWTGLELESFQARQRTGSRAELRKMLSDAEAAAKKLSEEQLGEMRPTEAEEEEGMWKEEELLVLPDDPEQPEDDHWLGEAAPLPEEKEGGRDWEQVLEAQRREQPEDGAPLVTEPKADEPEQAGEQWVSEEEYLKRYGDDTAPELQQRLLSGENLQPAPETQRAFKKPLKTKEQKKQEKEKEQELKKKSARAKGNELVQKQRQVASGQQPLPAYESLQDLLIEDEIRVRPLAHPSLLERIPDWASDPQFDRLLVRQLWWVAREAWALRQEHIDRHQWLPDDHPFAAKPRNRKPRWLQRLVAKKRQNDMSLIAALGTNFHEARQALCESVAQALKKPAEQLEALFSAPVIRPAVWNGLRHLAIGLPHVRRDRLVHPGDGYVYPSEVDKLVDGFLEAVMRPRIVNRSQRKNLRRRQKVQEAGVDAAGATQEGRVLTGLRSWSTAPASGAAGTEGNQLQEQEDEDGEGGERFALPLAVAPRVIVVFSSNFNLRSYIGMALAGRGYNVVQEPSSHAERHNVVEQLRSAPPMTFFMASRLYTTGVDLPNAEMLWNVMPPETIADYIGLSGKLCRTEISRPGQEASAEDPLDILHFGPEHRRLRGAGLVVTTVPTGISMARFTKKTGEAGPGLLAAVSRLQRMQAQLLQAEAEGEQEEELLPPVLRRRPMFTIDGVLDPSAFQGRPDPAFLEKILALGAPGSAVDQKQLLDIWGHLVGPEYRRALERRPALLAEILASWESDTNAAAVAADPQPLTEGQKRAPLDQLVRHVRKLGGAEEATEQGEDDLETELAAQEVAEKTEAKRSGKPRGVGPILLNVLWSRMQAHSLRQIQQVTDQLGVPLHRVTYSPRRPLLQDHALLLQELEEADAEETGWRGAPLQPSARPGLEREPGKELWEAGSRQ